VIFDDVIEFILECLDAASFPEKHIGFEYIITPLWLLISLKRDKRTEDIQVKMRVVRHVLKDTADQEILIENRQRAADSCRAAEIFFCGSFGDRNRLGTALSCKTEG